MVNEIAKILTDKGYTASGKLLHLKFKDYRGKCNWQLLINGTGKEQEAVADEWGKIKLKPFDFAVFWNGWLAGLFNPKGGQFSEHPEGANPCTFLKSLKLCAICSK